MEAAFNQWLWLDGALRVVAHRDGIDEQTVYTSEGGAYAIDGLYSGSYTLIVSLWLPEVSEALEIVEGLDRAVTTVDGATVYKSVGVVLQCRKSLSVACPTTAAAARVVLVWDRLPYDNLDLRLSFGQAGGASRCDTFSGRQRCGGTQWSGTSDRWRCDAPRCTSNVLARPVEDKFGVFSCEARIEWLRTHESATYPTERDACRQVAREFSEEEAGCGLCTPSTTVDPALAAGFARAEVIMLESIQSEGPYLVGVDAPLRLCHGYQLAAPGGATVDCVGNCASGKGYCRALGDVCAPCVLWHGSTPGLDPGSGPGGDAEPNQPALCPPGEAQGGPLPYTAEWDDSSQQCATLPSTLVVSDCAEADRAACSDYVDASGWPCACLSGTSGYSYMGSDGSGKCDADCSVSFGALTGRRLAQPSGGALTQRDDGAAGLAEPVGGEIAKAARAAAAGRRRLAHARPAQTQPCSDVMWAATDPAVYVVQHGLVQSVAVPGPSIHPAPLDHALTFCLSAAIPGQLSVVPVTNAGATANDGCVCQPTWTYVGFTYTNECSTTFESPERAWCYIQPETCSTGIVSANKECPGCLYQFCDAPMQEAAALPFAILDDAYFAQAEAAATCAQVNALAQGANQAALNQEAPCAPLTATLCLNTLYTYSVSEASACSVVHGSLRISAADGATVELTRVTAVGGDLVVEGNTALIRLTMRNLASVGGFRLVNSPNLANLSLPALATVGGAAVGAASVRDGDGALVVHTPSVPVYTQLQALVDAIGSGAKLVLMNGTYNGSGDAILGISKSIIITAQYRGGAVLDGEGSRRVILISGGAAVVLDGLVVTNGYHSAGGGLRVDGGSIVNIQSCDIVSNTAPYARPWEGGGGMFAGGGSVVLVYSSRIHGNTLRYCSDSCASASDGVCDDGTSSTFGAPCEWGNDCSDCGPRREHERNFYLHGGAGAAVTGLGTRVTFSECDISANDGTFGGGVSIHSGAAITFASVQIHRNTGYFGAGLYIDVDASQLSSTAVSISNSQIQFNDAWYHGGGVYIFRGAPTVTIESTQIVSNSAFYDGGGVRIKSSYSSNDNPITISDSVLMSNYAGNQGGGMFTDASDREVRATTLSSTQFINNNATFGYSALLVVRGLVTVNGCSSFDCDGEPDTTSVPYWWPNPTLPACFGTLPYYDAVINIVPPNVAC